MKFCTECGAGLRDAHGREAAEVFDEELRRKTNVLKLLTCRRCGRTADKYVEYDGTLILLDLTLQSEAAYRHVLLNGNYDKLILKMSFLTVLCDGYISWSSLTTAGEFFEQEYEFYVSCSQACLAMLAFLLVCLLPVVIRRGWLGLSDSRAAVAAADTPDLGGRAAVVVAAAADTQDLGVSTLALGLALTYSSRFYNLVALLWSGNGVGGGDSDVAAAAVSSARTSLLAEVFVPGLMWTFVHLLFLVSSVKVYQVLCGRGPFASFALVALGHAAFIAVFNLDSIISPHRCAPL